jgi:uncharacterized membrane protein (UPF0127 family)
MNGLVMGDNSFNAVRALCRAVVLAVTCGVLFGACAGSDADATHTSTPPTTQPAQTTTGVDVATPPDLVPLEGFGRGVAVVDGRELNVLLATSGEQRSQGLMLVEDLNGWDGMWFQFDGPVSGGFWMKNTLLPLSIAWIDAEGRVVAIADMEPCVVDDCPSYRPGSEYVSALEVEQGRFETLGIGVGSVIQLR